MVEVSMMLLIFFFLSHYAAILKRKRTTHFGNKIIEEKNALPETDWTFVPDKCEDLICPC
jgi:hypothetical protein